MQGISLPLDVIIRYSTIIVWVIVAIVIAKIISELVWWLLKKANFLKKAFKKIDVSIDLNLIWNIVSKGLYFIIILAWVVWILEYLNIEIPILNDILDDFIPRIINALWLTIIAWLLASIAKIAIIKWSKVMDLNKKLSSWVNVSESIGVIAYWAVIIFFLPQILEELGQNELLKPITNIIDSVTWYIPNIIGASIIFIIWLFIAKIIKQITVSVLNSLNVDEASKKFGLNDFSISNLAGTIAYVLILLPVAIQALDKLKIGVISEPATEMLQQIINMIPLLFTAWIIITISYFIWRFVSRLISELLSWAWFDKVLKLIGLKSVKSTTKPSEIIGHLAFIYIILLAVVEATSTIGFMTIAALVNEFILFATNVLVGIVILGLWLFLANLAEKAIRTASDSKILINIAKTAIIVLTAFMWLQQMWIGWEIITQAFTLVLWAVAVAFALAVWLGWKDIAANEVKKFVENLKK